MVMGISITYYTIAQVRPLQDTIQSEPVSLGEVVVFANKFPEKLDL